MATTAVTTGMLRGSLPDYPVFGSPEHERLLQYDVSRLTGACNSLDVVDACRGTGVRREYTGTFAPYDGSCAGEFLDELPIYFNRQKTLYMYPIDVYPEHWSVKALRGLVRWRIASFKTFSDTETCRREEANIFQIDFAADGQPYNYFPTISCFDEFADDFSGFKVSTITIICNDIVVSAPSSPPVENGGVAAPPPSDPGGGGGGFGVIIGIIAVVLLVGIVFYLYAKNRKEQGQSVFPWGSGDDEEDKKKRKAKREAKLEAKRKAKEDEEAGKKLVEQKPCSSDGGSTEKDEPSKEEPPKEIPIIYPPTRKLSRNDSKRASLDPPARIKPPAEKVDDAVPDDIQKMVAELDNLLDDELKNSIVEPKRPRGRSRSLEPEKATTYADNSKRSNSLERSKAIAMDYFDRSADAAANLYDGLRKRAKSLKKKDFLDGSGSLHSLDDRRERERSESLERRKSGDYANDRSRSRSKERSGADDYARDRARSRSAERSRASDFADRDRGRSRSKERSKTDDYADDRGRSRSKERSKTDDYADDRGRSRSKERSKADDYAGDRGRSRSKERSKADDYARDRGRSKSIERSKSNDYSKDRGRSSSKERSKADDHANKRERSKSIEKHRSKSLEPAGATASALDPPKRSASGWAPGSTHNKTVGKSKSLDASKAGKTVTKNPDGSVLVTAKRMRDDGAIVTTKTKYASVALARKHGIDV